MDQSTHSNGPAEFRLFYSTDGTNFTSFGTQNYIIPRQIPSQGIWNATDRRANAIFSFDLGGIAELQDAETVYFRITLMDETSASGGVISGRSVIDNVVVNGNTVPEPAATLLGALGLAGLLRRRR